MEAYSKRYSHFFKDLALKLADKLAKHYNLPTDQYWFIDKLQINSIEQHHGVWYAYFYNPDPAVPDTYFTINKIMHNDFTELINYKF